MTKREQRRCREMVMAVVDRLMLEERMQAQVSGEYLFRKYLNP